MHKLSNIRFNADKRDYAHLQIKRMLAAEYDYDTVSIFSSGMDAARITQKRCFGSVRNSQPKVYKDVHFWRCDNAVDAPYICKRRNL